MKIYNYSNFSDYLFSTLYSLEKRMLVYIHLFLNLIMWDLIKVFVNCWNVTVFVCFRYTQPPADLWDWYDEYLEDPEVSNYFVIFRHYYSMFKKSF